MAQWGSLSRDDAMAMTRSPSHDVSSPAVPTVQAALMDRAVDATTLPPAMTLPDLPLSDFHHQACGFRNSSDRMVIVRCTGPDEFFLERVVFPFELLSFACPAGTDVQIWTHGLGGPELLETIPAADLLIDPVVSHPAEPLPFEELNPWAKAG